MREISDYFYGKFAWYVPQKLNYDQQWFPVIYITGNQQWYIYIYSDIYIYIYIYIYTDQQWYIYIYILQISHTTKSVTDLRKLRKRYLKIVE